MPRDLSSLTTKRRWVILPVESNVRELHARTLLAAVAAERGFGVVIGRTAELPRFLPALPAAALMYMSAVTPAVFQGAREQGHVPTALDEEGLIRRSRDDYLRRRVPTGALESCARFFAWGEEHRDLLLSTARHLADRIVSVGNPRIDLLRPRLRDIYRGEADSLRRRYGRFVLLNSNLGTFNHQLGTEARLREWRERRWSDSEQTERSVHQMIDFQRAMFQEFIALVDALDRDLPNDVGIIVRPHPAERLETWRECLTGRKRVRVIHEGPAIPWLLACEMLIHNSCTTGIEADLLGRPSIAFVPVPDDVAEAALANHVGLRCSTRECVLQDTRMAMTNPEHVRRGSSNAVLSRHIANLTGTLACEAIVDEFEAVAPHASEFNHPERMRRRIHWGRAVLWTRSAASGVRHRRLRQERQGAAYIRRASPAIATAEVAGVLRSLTAATRRFKHLQAATLAPDLVIVGQRR